MNRYICIHGHFYQPPRENPWLNEVELQDSAYPFHDWNERINAECYARNTASRILDEGGRIEDIVNNYSRISFNFGPTLLSWMEKKAADTYSAILQADRESMEYFSGHGSALAQVYNHMIMPLANERDKHTQVLWGIKDFEHRFGRKPEGMWLSETAVDTPTLEALAAHDIKFTILSPYQAAKVRSMDNGGEWKNVEGGKVDPKKAYLCNLPSGKTISLFFYDGPVSRAIAFEKLLSSGEKFAGRLTDHFEDDDAPQLMNIATDGETYGHHHYLGEMGLSYALHHIEKNNLARITNYAEFLEKHPPEYEAQILENTSWSCVHGIERWRSNCGCNSGGHGSWNQEWRGPLRDAFDWVREQLIPLYEKEMKGFTDDPWRARDEYLQVILDRSEKNVERFIAEHTQKELSHEEKVKFLKLLEMQYHAMLMYTSCGWFFDEVTGIESMQDVLYAARAIQLANDISKKDLEREFSEHLSKAKSNLPEHEHAASAYEKFVKPTMLDLSRVGAHYAVSSLFSNYPQEAKIYSYTAQADEYYNYRGGRQKLAIGKVTIRSEITWEEERVSFAVLHLGDHNIIGGVGEFSAELSFEEIHKKMEDSFKRSNIYETMFLIDKYIGAHIYSFWHLFKDEQKRILDLVLKKNVKRTEMNLNQIFEDNVPVIKAFKEVNQSMPDSLKVTVNFVINARMQKLFKQDKPDLAGFKKAHEDIQQLSADLDEVTLEYAATQQLNRLLQDLEQQIINVQLISTVKDYLQLLNQVYLYPDLWRARNVAFDILKNHYPLFKKNSEKGEEAAQRWCREFRKLAKGLNLKVE